MTAARRLLTAVVDLIRDEPDYMAPWAGREPGELGRRS